MPAPRRPLIVTADPGLLDELLRLAAVGSAETTVAPDPAAARGHWTRAPFVLVGIDQAAACLRAQLPRRNRIILIGWAGTIDPAWNIAELLAADSVAVLPEAAPWIVDQFHQRSGRPITARTLAVIGGRGGAGASTLAAGLATTAVRHGFRTLLIDADPLGGGLDLVLGWEDVGGLRWPSLTEADGRVDPPALLRALPHRGDLVLLSFDRAELPGVPAEAMAATLDAARRGRDVIVADLPRQLDDAALLALRAADRTLLVVPAELRATASARRTADTIREHCDDLAVVVRGPAPGRLRPRDISTALHLPLAGTIRPEKTVCEGVEEGLPPTATGRGSLAALCLRLIGDLTGTELKADAA